MLMALDGTVASQTHTVLCVDDEPQILEALALTLGRQYQVNMAPSGLAALEMLRAAPDTTVIISDMRMPSMNGAQFLAAARKIAPHARRILLTGHADVASAVQAVNEGGIFRLLTKPCSSARLSEAVEAAIADHDADARERNEIRENAKEEILSKDPLTGLSSPASLLERLDRCRGAEGASEWRPEVLFVIEIGGVDELSDGYDCKAAEHIFRLLAMRLRAHLANAECLARYPETMFVALLIPRDSSDAALETLASSIVAALEVPLAQDGIAQQIRVAVGIARIPIGTNTDPRSALRYAELAAREAKRHGSDPVRLFSRESIVRNERRRETVQALRTAVAQQQLSLHYQPIVDIERGTVYSIEALARWQHEKLGTVPPNTFIPLAEEIGLMIPLGEWVMNRACADARLLSGPQFGRVSVNCSVSQLLDSRFLYGLYQAIEKSGIDPKALELELTETVFAEDVDRVCTLLSDVRLLGVSVAIDDFGAGYSSLAYLTRLPIDVLKIDKTFVENFDRGGEAIIGAALAVARTLKIEVIVEGVETEQALRQLRALGATKIQGYVFAKPMPVNALMAWHADFQSRHGPAQ